jgi:hypothetical protein
MMRIGIALVLSAFLAYPHNPVENNHPTLGALRHHKTKRERRPNLRC